MTILGRRRCRGSVNGSLCGVFGVFGWFSALSSPAQFRSGSLIGVYGRRAFDGNRERKIIRGVVSQVDEFGHFNRGETAEQKRHNKQEAEPVSSNARRIHRDSFIHRTACQLNLSKTSHRQARRESVTPSLRISPLSAGCLEPKKSSLWQEKSGGTARAGAVSNLRCRD